MWSLSVTDKVHTFRREGLGGFSSSRQQLYLLMSIYTLGQAPLNILAMQYIAGSWRVLLNLKFKYTDSPRFEVASPEPGFKRMYVELLL